MIFNRLRSTLQNLSAPQTQPLTLDDPAGWSLGHTMLAPGRAAAMRLSAVNACVEIISNSIAKMPVYLMQNTTKERVQNPLLQVLCMRPNAAMTPFDFWKLLEVNRLTRGNGYAWIHRDAISQQVLELIPLPPDCVTPRMDSSGVLWYFYADPVSGRLYKLEQLDVLHYKAYSTDGITGISVLSRAAAVLGVAQQAQQYEQAYYANGTQIPGVLSTEGDLSPGAREKIRAEWERIHAGTDKAFRTAVLDNGIKYQPIGITNRDSQFIESKMLTLADIARFFGVPLYKLGEGKQSYSSNEQNAIEYVVGTLHPIVSRMEDEDSYKLLLPSEQAQGLCLRRNMMAELRGDNASRAAWYKNMREIGAFSINDILALEDMPAVEGGEVRMASLNYVPLDLFRTLSQQRNGGSA